MKAPVCVKCERAMRCVEVGTELLEMYHGTYRDDPQEPYKLWHADRFVCSGCGAQVLSGMTRPWAQEHEPGFETKVRQARSRRHVHSYEFPYPKGEEAADGEPTGGRVEDAINHLPSDGSGLEAGYIVMRMEDDGESPSS